MIYKLVCSINFSKLCLVFLSLSLLSCGSSNNSSGRADIVFLAVIDTPETFELYHTDGRGGKPARISHNLPESASVVDFSLSPNGKNVADKASSGVYLAEELLKTGEGSCGDAIKRLTKLERYAVSI